MFRRALCIAVMLTLSGGVLAQTKKKPNTKPAKGAGRVVTATRQAAAMKDAAEMFVGRWRTEEKFEKNEMMPNGGSGHGAATNVLGAGDLYIVSDYHSVQTPSGKFSGHGVMWYDPNANGYRAVWCDSMSQFGCDDMGLGKWDEQHANLVFEGDSEMMGQKYHFRNTYTDLDQRSFTFVMEAGPSADQMQKIGTIKYTRVGSIPRNLAPKNNPKVKE